MKKIISIITLCAAVICAAACSEQELSIAGGLSVTLRTSDLTTKATVPGVDALNENTIKSVDWFIYADGDESAAVRSGHVEADANNDFTFVIDFKETDYNAVFTSNTAKIYTAVNLPSGTEIASDSSLETVKATVLSAEFASNSVQPLFVMRGEGTITADKAAGTGTATVELLRVASKIQIAVTSVASHEDESGNIWYAQPATISYKFVNANSTAVLDGEAQASSDASIFNVDEKRAAYYSYPMTWDFTGNAPEPYFMITMNVADSENVTSETVVRTCYYKAVLPNQVFESNTWYTYSVNLKMLGSFSEVEPIVVPVGDYYVYDWGGETHTQGGTTDGAIYDIRYLTVDRNEYTAYNKSTLEIPFTTSHSAVVVNQKVTYRGYNGTAIVNTTEDVDWVSVSGNTIVFNHPLNNDINSPDLDVTPYTVTFRLQHADNPSIFEDITILQTPAIIISDEQNTATGTGNTGLGTRGDVYVNGQTRNIFGSTPYYNTIRTRSEGYMYSIETLVLPDGSDYIVADPRFDQPNKIMIPYCEKTGSGSYGLGAPGEVINLFSGTSASSTSNPGLADGPALYGDSPRKMQYYYATQTTKESENFIAPKFRVASSFCSAGAVGNSTKYFDMARRCATYQEAGYPAGRWRIPTLAEVRYVIQLQFLGKVPFIFNEGSDTNANNSGYYCSSNSLNGTFKNGWFITDEISQVHSIRCVYDDWYWENMDNGGKVAKDTFTWGDMPR